MKTKLAILFVPLFLMFRSTAQTEPTMVVTFAECLRLSKDHSPALKISAAEQEKLKYGFRETQGRGLPSVSASGSFDHYINLPTQLIPGEFFQQPGTMIPVQFGTNYNLSGSLDVSQLIYDQQFIVALRLSKQMVQKGLLDTQKTETDLVFTVAQSYYLTQITKKEILNLKTSLSNLEKAEFIARSQFDNGFIRKIDVDRITVDKLNLQTRLDHLEALFLQQVNMLKYLMGTDLKENIDVEDSVMGVGAGTNPAADFTNHIDLLLLEKQKDLAKSNLSLARASYLPSLRIFGSTGYTNQSNTYYAFGKNTDWFNTSLAGLRLNVPIFDGFQRRSRAGQAKVSLEQVRIQEEDTRQMLAVQSQDAYVNLITAITAETRQKDNQDLATRVLTISQDQYEKGTIPLTDLLNAQKALNDAQYGHVNALIHMKIAELELMKANGTLLNIANPEKK